MRMHDFCRSLGLFKSKKSKKKDGDRRGEEDGKRRAAGDEPREEGRAGPANPSTTTAVVGPVFVTTGCYDPWQTTRETGTCGDSALPARDLTPPPGYERGNQSAEGPAGGERGRGGSCSKVSRQGSVKSDISAKSKQSQRSEATTTTTSRDSQGYNGDRAFSLSRTASGKGNNRPRDPGEDSEDTSVSRYIDDDGELSHLECCYHAGSQPRERTPPRTSPFRHTGSQQAATTPKTAIRRSATIAMGDNYSRQPTTRVSHVERNRFLEKKRILPAYGRPTRREGERKDQQRPHSHHPHHHYNHHHHHHQGQGRQGRAGHQPRTTSSSGHERRKTLGSVDPNEVKMLALASKALTDHVKDMTEKTRTRCCVVPGKQIEKENLINNHHMLSGLEPHNYIVDHARETTYIKGKLLGKGGFAKCYELTDIQSGKTYACKIISKNRLSKPHQKEKIAREVELHKHLNHQNVVGFHSYFEDNENVYIVLEHCSRKSLVHVLKSRKTVTEPEVRVYLRQLVEGCRYIHSQKIIHRDLKLGNMLLSEGMNVKIADFGLATRVEYDGEKKMTVCGTPNYIAPEVLQKKGHSYEADIWAMGCIMYALLLGRPPFETSTLKETYMRITANKYSIPSHVSPSARNLIQSLLSADPARRPSLDKILQHEFLTSGYSPNTLPTSCCDTAPKFPLSAPTPTQNGTSQTHHPTSQVATVTSSSQTSRPKSYAAPVSATEAMQRITSSLAQLRPTQGQAVMNCHSGDSKSRARSPSPVTARTKSPTVRTTTITTTASAFSGPRNPPTATVARPSSTGSSTGSEGSSSYGSRPSSTEIKALPIGSSIRLYQLLASCLEQMPDDANPSAVHNAVPLWVTKWVDYSNKYGFGFQLSDRSVGVLFNDTTRMMLSSDGEVIYYNDLSNKVYSFAAHAPPREHEKKSTLLKYFAQYMDEHLIHGGDLVQGRAAQHPAPPRPAAQAAPGQGTFMKKWFRTSKAIVMYLNNGTLQVNFFDDHTKVILSPEGQDYLVTYINTHRQSVTYRLLHFRHFGCNADIQQRLQYARRMLESIINIEGEAV